ncbi:Os04g0375300 [Oryza sativa Japonica Group]|uniref:OSJNBb0006N15.3 protein n=1 Tax=Oryza sativa subsp. japonica TaxID=39947 RepID=Q7FAG3_ORYSJ|nr:Os04g0375300 [Oryza sativa Japonica Group]CAE04586.2 OSJNBb0006N15.3 [Oryza sativa Japonica Group]|eukprot:NP_001052576.1 Os04g0375300 [Oryza sativa Japonica Group]
MDDIVGILKGAAGLAADANAFREFFNWAAPRVLAAVRSQQQQHLLQVDPGGVGSASARDNRTAPLHQIEDDLQNLENDLWLIQSTTSTMYDLIDRLEWHSHKDTEDWHLRQIKDVAYDAEDLLDEYNYYALKVKVDTSKNLGQDHSHEPFLEFLNSVNFSKVMKIKNRLKQVFDQSKGLGFHKTPKKFDRLVRPETCRVLDEPDEIFGREKELKELKQNLGVRGRKRGRPVACSTTAEARRTELPVLPIVGMGGIGKTTMAQQICEDRVVRNHFDCILWICVSDEFEVNRLTRDVLKSLGVKSQDSDTRDTLMVNLRDSVKSKKFLLVLDDMWDDVLKDERGWRTFHRTLSNGLQGSMILVTTRSSKVANLVSNSDPYELNGLQNDVFWDFFKLCAFGSNSSRNSPELEHIRPELERIGRAILPKLKGSPLAAKTLGRLLKSNLSVEHWEDILRSELWKLEQEETDILPALRLSYVYLPRHMKRCFSICALYPKDHKFDKEFLADIWVAQGYVEAEDASSCFNDLVNRSFFQKAAGYSDMYVIHDLIHDTAQLVSKDECFIIQHVSDLAKIPSKVRHLSIFTKGNISCTEIVTICTQNKKLRSLICNESYRSIKQFAPVIDCWFKELPSIRVLIFKFSTVRKLPESIGNSKHLRYLGLLGSSTFETLPSSVSCLYHVQTINAKGCVFKRYPQGFSDLISLNKIESKGFQFNKVKDKQFLEWSTTEIADEQLQMTEEQIELLPHWNLEHLIIKNYLGQSCPSWLQPDCLKVLTSLELYGCRNIQSLSFFDPLFSDLEESNSIYHLEVLDVHQCPNIDWQGLVALPSSLRRVTLGNFGHSTDHFVSCFRGLSLLTHLEIHCWFLTSIPLQVWMSNLPSLENLRIDNCGSLTSICVSEASNIHTVGVFSSLSTVTISFCNALLSLDEFFMPAYMPFVKTIDVLFCKELALLPVHELHLFSRLEKLCIRNCPKLNMQRRMTLPSSLRMLSLLLCPSIEYIDNSHLASAMKLKGLSLQLMRCPDLISIVGAISVSEIVQGRIEDCPKLMEITQPFKVMTESQKKVQPDQTMGRLGDENLKN